MAAALLQALLQAALQAALRAALRALLLALVLQALAAARSSQPSHADNSNRLSAPPAKGTWRTGSPR
jgi:hypothetical protein